MVRGCNCAIMAAANTGNARLFREEPWKLINENLIMNSRMLEVFYKEKINRVIYIGSATLYQDFDGHMVEDGLDLNIDPPRAYYGFGWVVRFIEKLCNFWHKECGMEILIARVANIFGPFARFDPLNSNFIPAIIRKAVDKMEPFEVWGSPDVTRDVIYSEDFGKAIVSMMEKQDIKFDVFNIGSGVRVRVGDVVELALKYAGHIPRKIEYLSHRPTTTGFRALDTGRANKMLGWYPQHNIEEAIKKTTEWWIENRRWWKK